MKILSSRAKAKSFLKPTDLHLELALCESFPAHFIRTHVYIPKGSVGGFTLFDLYKCQESYLDVVEKKGGVTLLAHCRGAGITSTNLAYLLWQALFKPGSRSVFLCPKPALMDAAKNLLMSMHSNLDVMLQPSVLRETFSYVEFGNGSSIRFGLLDSSSCGMFANTVVMSDFAAIKSDQQHQTLMSFMPIVHPGGRVIITSTPRAFGDTFHDMWELGHAGLSVANALRITYHDLPYASASGWAQLQSYLGSNTVNREYGAEFT